MKRNNGLESTPNDERRDITGRGRLDQKPDGGIAGGSRYDGFVAAEGELQDIVALAVAHELDAGNADRGLPPDQHRTGLGPYLPQNPADRQRRIISMSSSGKCQACGSGPFQGDLPDTPLLSFLLLGQSPDSYDDI